MPDHRTATNVVVKDTIPAEVSVLTVTPSVGSCTAGIPGNPLQPLTCTIDTMAANGSATITVVAKVNSNVPERNGDQQQRDGGERGALDTNNGNNSATAAVTVNARGRPGHRQDFGRGGSTSRRGSSPTR